MPAEMFKVIASFHDANGQPLTGSEYSVALRDKDLFFDGRLGESLLDDSGAAGFLVAVADILSFDSPGERTPDLYFVVKQAGQEIFRSDIFADVNFDTVSEVTGRPDGLTKAFGPFRVTEPGQG